VGGQIRSSGLWDIFKTAQIGIIESNIVEVVLLVHILVRYTFNNKVPCQTPLLEPG